jgi:hypothetical protein
MPTTPTMAQTLAAEGIADYTQDLRQLSAVELRGLFAFASSGKINATRVIKNLIWQAYTAIRDGRRPPIAGNLRSFWYTDIKPVLSRLGVPVEGRRATELVYDAFVELVTRHHLFHYRDLGFLDEGAQTRAVGQTNGTLILCAEKDGRFALMRDIAQPYDATALALGGFPSSLATEYLLHALQQAGVLAQPAAMHLFSVVDYDPSGYWIAHEFAAQLQAFGVQEVTLHPLIRPERLTAEQVALGRYALPKGSKTTNWLRETGGIDGEPYGLEADAFPPEVIQAAFVAEATPSHWRPGWRSSLPWRLASCWRLHATCARGWCLARSRPRQRWRSALCRWTRRSCESWYSACGRGCLWSQCRPDKAGQERAVGSPGKKLYG